ncbi:MAG: hypothetical protein IKR19_08275 [Acholeplasmatales bacterium]|nr:hypothetical protein [Acholeplasmatales bacterium]
MTKDEKVHLYGPYDRFGNLQSIFTRSGSFASQLYRDFKKVQVDKIGDDILKPFEKIYDLEEHLDPKDLDLKYLYVKDLPNTNFIKSRYVHMEDAKSYIEQTKNNDIVDIDEIYMHNVYTLEEYGLELNKALNNDNTDKIQELKEYVFFSYPDYFSKEYESFMIMNYISNSVESWKMKRSIRDNGEDILANIILLDIG